jgi:ADP-heptose:LPS heptosyltransferase
LEPRNILVLRPRFLGDVILATGLAETLKSALPGARVSFLTQAPFTEVLRHDPDWDEVLSFDASRRNNIPYLFRFIRDLRRRRFDAVLDLFGNPRTVQMALLSGAKVRVGYRLRGRSWAYTHVAPPSSPPLPSGRRPVTEAYLDQVRALGVVPTAPYRTRIVVTEGERQAARSFLRGQGWDGERVVCVAPGATWPAKRWHAERFLAVGKGLIEQGVRPLFVFGPSEGALKDFFRARWVKGFLKAEDRPLRELFALVEGSSALLSNDAGPMHVGPAVGTPTIGIFGPGEPEIWFPYGRPHEALHREIGCSHCGLDDCGRPDCMIALPSDAVLDRVLAAAQTGPVRPG